MAVGCVTVVDSALSDAHEISITPASIERSAQAIVVVFILASDAASLSAVAVVVVVLTIIMSSIPVVAAAFAAHVLTVDPMMSVVRHVAWDPNHFIVAGPIARAMVIKWSVADLDRDALCSHSDWSDNARCNNGGEQKFVFNHPPTDHEPTVPANTVSVSRDTFLVWLFACGQLK